MPHLGTCAYGHKRDYSELRANVFYDCKYGCWDPPFCGDGRWPTACQFKWYCMLQACCHRLATKYRSSAISALFQQLQRECDLLTYELQL
jgi:hypothetical protein